MEAYFATPNLVKSSTSDFLTIFATSENGEKQIVSHINRLVSVAYTRTKGFHILKESLSILSADTITEHMFTWMKYCLVQHDKYCSKKIKLEVLTKIIPFTRSKRDLDKTFITDYLPKILEMCLSSNCKDNNEDNQNAAALECLTVCLISYPNWFGPHFRRIETFLLKSLDHTSIEVTKKSAMAFLYLQQSGGGGLNKANYITNFATSFNRLVRTADKLLDNLMTFTEIETQRESEILPYDVPLKNTGNIIDVYYKTSQLLISLITYLKIMIQNEFSAPKSIKPKIILDFIRRGMDIHICVSSGEVPDEDWHKTDCVKQLQIHLLDLLQTFLCWLRYDAFLFSNNITHILVDVLVRSDKCKCFRVNRHYLEVLHNVFLEWINISKSIDRNSETKVFLVLLNNITPVSDNVVLNLDLALLKGKSKKAKRKAIEERVINHNQKSPFHKSCPEQFKFILENSTHLALRTLTSLLTAMTGVNRNMVKRIFKVIVKVALDIQVERCPVPYENIQCQIGLYEALIAFLEQDYASYLISLHPICMILNEGMNNRNKRISAVCEVGLRIIEKISQPVCPYFVQSSSDEVPREEMSMSDQEGNILDIENEESICKTPPSVENNALDEAESTIEEMDTVEIQDKSINIVDVQIIKPADNGDNNSSNPEINTPNPEMNTDTNLNGHSCDSPIEDSETIQIDDSEGEVEFVKEQIIIPDENEDGDRNEESRKDDEEEGYIETVNQLLEETEEPCKTENRPAENKSEDVNNDDEFNDDDDMCGSFVEEMVDL